MNYKSVSYVEVGELFAGLDDAWACFAFTDFTDVTWGNQFCRTLVTASAFLDRIVDVMAEDEASESNKDDRSERLDAQIAALRDRVASLPEDCYINLEAE